MKIKVIIENVTYHLFYTPKIVSGKYCKFYKPLLTTLWDKLTENQKNKIIIFNPIKPEQKIIYFDDIVACFKQRIGHTLKCNNIYPANQDMEENINKYVCNSDETLNNEFEYNYCHNDGECACGVKIQYEHIIENIETHKFYIIGSECIDWWNRKRDTNKTKAIIKAVLEKKEIPKFCSFCKSSRDCKNCKEKGQLKSIFQEWRQNSKISIKKLLLSLNETVKFGKYKDKTFYELCQNSGYSQFILNNNFDEKTKTKINDYIRYQKILVKPEYKEYFKD
jgi:hypothetical protein